jgi:muramoyltetrapeptide carboxypeptidase LdcA involved in peptidoglycan recycling
VPWGQFQLADIGGVSHRRTKVIGSANYSLEGSKGAAEVVAELKKREPELLATPNRGIPIIGYSDTTFLQHYLGERGLASPVQGPVPAYRATNDKEYMALARERRSRSRQHGITSRRSAIS